MAPEGWGAQLSTPYLVSARPRPSPQSQPQRSAFGVPKGDPDPRLARRSAPWTSSAASLLDSRNLCVPRSRRGDLGGPRPKPVDDVLDALARSRRVRLRLPSPLLAPQMALQSDLVVTTARWLAMHLADQDGVVVRRLHERGATDPHQRWFRDRLAAVAAALAPARLRW